MNSRDNKRFDSLFNKFQNLTDEYDNIANNAYNKGFSGSAIERLQDLDREVGSVSEKLVNLLDKYDD